MGNRIERGRSHNFYQCNIFYFMVNILFCRLGYKDIFIRQIGMIMKEDEVFLDGENWRCTGII